MTQETRKVWSLYKITNVVNNKVYIGQAADISKRWSDHRRAFKLNKPKQAIHYAFIKYNLKNFIFEVIVSCKTQEDANEIETLLVTQYDSFISNNKGYNVTFGGNNAPKSEEWKQSIRNWHASQTEEQKEILNKKRSEAILKQIETQGPPGLGSKRTDEQRANMSLVQKSLDKDKIYTEEVRQRMSEAHIGIKDSEETKQKKSEIQKLKWEQRMVSTEEPKCSVPNCNVLGFYIQYRIIDGVRYCFNHGQKLKRSGTLEPSPKHIQNNFTEEERKKCGQANIGKIPHNKISFTDEQVKLILDFSRSIKSLSREFHVTEKVIARIRKDNNKI